MIKQVITVNHKKFATGLFWQPVGVGNTAHNFVKNLVKNTGKKYNLYIEYRSMVGLGNSASGIRSGMQSIAAEIVSSMHEFISFMGVFQADKYFYLIAVRNGIIIRDILIESESEARKLYSDLSNIPDWGALFAPTSWGMPRSQEKFLSDLVSYGVSGRLKYISVTKSVFPSIIFVILFLMLGLYVFDLSKNNLVSNHENKLNPELAAEYKRQIELKNQELDKKFEITKKQAEKIEYPYDNLPDIYERANLCYKAIGFLMQPIPGWNQTYAKCDGEYVSATFSRDFGNLNDFYEIGAEFLPGAVVQQLSDNEILVRAKLPNLKTSASIDERDQITAMRDIATNFQKINIKADIEAVSDTLTNGADTENINVIEIAATSKLIPIEFMQIFNDFDGVYMTSVNWRANTRTWNYEIIVYTK